MFVTWFNHKNKAFPQSNGLEKQKVERFCCHLIKEKVRQMFWKLKHPLEGAKSDKVYHAIREKPDTENKVWTVRKNLWLQHIKTMFQAYFLNFQVILSA